MKIQLEQKLNLKTCPICGSNPLLSTNDMGESNNRGYSEEFMFYFYCPFCQRVEGDSFSTIHYKGEKECIKKAADSWNEEVDKKKSFFNKREIGIMNEIKDYNKKLLTAFNSWFWYNGLLEQEGDEWVDFEHISRPKYTENCTILTLIKALREIENDDDSFLTLEDLKTKYNLEMYYNEELNVLWLLLVEMFGDCGCSPRSGWIDEKKECADFLETIVEIEELQYVKGGNEK